MRKLLKNYSPIFTERIRNGIIQWRWNRTIKNKKGIIKSIYKFFIVKQTQTNFFSKVLIMKNKVRKYVFLLLQYYNEVSSIQHAYRESIKTRETQIIKLEEIWDREAFGSILRKNWNSKKLLHYENDMLFVRPF